MPRPRNVELSAAEAHLSTADFADQRVVAADTERLSERISGAIRDAMEEMTLEDRTIVRFHFGSSFTIAEIAGLLRLPQRPLYRRVEALLQRLRKKLAAVGIAAADVADLIGSATAEMDFGLRNGKREDARPTNTDGTQREVEEAG
jgi:DNA-directed RNA polymerase specialized sigma24 family protein